MSFIRKRSIDLKSPHLQNNIQSLNSATLSNMSQSDKYQKPSKNSSQILQLIKKSKEGFVKLPQEKWEKQISQVLQSVVDIKKGILLGQKLTIHRDCLQLVTKYQQQLKKVGKQFNQQNCSLCLHLFKSIVEELSKATQQQKNDELILQANIGQSLFQLLQCLAIAAEGEFNNKQKRPSLMRKNSLKKVQELPIVRPSSRGKLASLSKKQSITSKKDILDIRPPSKQQRTQKSPFQQLILGLCCIAKNLSANSKIRKQLMKQEHLRIINRYLCIWNDKNITPFGTSLMVQLTACYRHLAVQDKSHKIFLKSNCFDTWARLIQMFPTSNDIIFNLLRILSKLSNYESCCVKLYQKKQCLKNLCGFFKFYKNNIHIIIRIAFIFANMTSYIADIRNEIYFQFEAWKDIYVCFDHYATSQLSGKNQVQKMGLSMAAWDYQAIKKQSDIEAIIKIIRLIANLFTVNNIGSDIYMNDSQSYKQLIKKLKGLLQKKSNIQKSSELIACILSCLTNVLYYDKQTLMSNPEYKTIKIQLVNVLVDFVVQIDNQQICCQSLRVISNITRMKQYVKTVLQVKIHQAVVILLQSTSKQIVYYSLGILSNLLVDDDFKQQYKEIIINGVLDIMNECESEDFDLVTVGLKTLACIFDARNQNIDPETMGKIQACLINMGSHCDRVMIDKQKQNTMGQISSIQQSRSLINMLLNNMPQQKYTCPIKNCGRRFADDVKLQDHVKRRHKAA